MIAGFDHYTLDTERRLLLRSEEPLHLSPKAFDLLLVLVSEGPRAISKAELNDRIWPAVFVSESNLAGLVAELRSALGDQARRPRYIRTVHGFGYAFSASVTRDGQSSRTPVAWLTCDGSEHPLFEGQNLIGRDRSADLRIDHPTVSRRHAIISISSKGVTLEDLGSKNGTSINSRTLHGSAQIADGAEIGVGTVRTRFRTDPTKSSTLTVKR